MRSHFIFNRMEFSGSLGDLGTILPLAIAMVIINGVSASGVFLCFGLYYIASGFYFQVTSPVEPMKIIAAYSIAHGITASQIQSSSLLIAILLIFLGATGLISSLSRNIPISVIRGVQLSTGILLIIKGIQLIAGISPYQVLHGAAEPHLSIEALGPFPIGMVLGGLLSILTLFLLDNKKTPAAVTVVFIGLIIGFILQQPSKQNLPLFNFSLPALLPYGIPSWQDFSFALVFLVLPQIPMTIGNAVIANADLCQQYFPETGKKVTNRTLCLSMGIANFFCFFLGGIPMCHGAGGLASRYRFGARTAGSNIIIGVLFVSLVLIFGDNILTMLNVIPMAVLGVLLFFAGTQLSLTLLDIRSRKDLFVVIIILGITLATNLAAGFLLGIAVAMVIRSEKISV